MVRDGQVEGGRRVAGAVAGCGVFSVTCHTLRMVWMVSYSCGFISIPANVTLGGENLSQFTASSYLPQYVQYYLTAQR